MPGQSTILIVDDEPALRYALRRVFEPDYEISEAGSVEEARGLLAGVRPEIVLLDYSLPGADGLVLLNEICAGGDPPPVIMMTAHGSEAVAVRAMKAGAYDYLVKPFDVEELRLVVLRAADHQELRHEVRGLRERLAGEGQFGRMVGESGIMRDLFRTAERVAQSDLPVLLLGESGTGKDLLAQEIHARSSRHRNRFVALNCAALPENLVESELFGYERGAFTGATVARSGKFETAHKGTLFLDEIGDMAPATQSKILRVTENGVVERIGGTRPIPLDVRLVCATNKDLQKEMRAGHFREDLYFRLAGVTLYVPPLRNRAGDIPLLVDRFWSDVQNRHQRRGPELTREAMVALQQAAWPGNVRQLRSTVERLFVLVREGQVTASDVELAIGPQPVKEPSEWSAFATSDYREARRSFEVEYLTRKLREFGGNVTRTASAIGMERQSLQEKIRKLGVTRG